MKKLITIGICAISCAAFAALDFSAAKTLPVFAPVSISAATTNEVVMNAVDWKGAAEIVVVPTDAYGRTLDVTLWATNANEGGWSVYAAKTFSVTNGLVARLAFPADYLPKTVKVGVGSLGAASTASAMILTY